MKKQLIIAALIILSASTSYAGLLSFGTGGLGSSGFGTTGIAGNLDVDTRKPTDDQLAGAIDVDTDATSPDASLQTESKVQARTRTRLNK